MLKPSDVVEEVRAVLAAANRGKGHAPHFLTAYQILERLPHALRDQLISERGMPGEKAGVYHAAASVVKDALLHQLRSEIEIAYFDNVGASFDVAGSSVRGGYPVCGLYRLIEGEQNAV